MNRIQEHYIVQDHLSELHSYSYDCFCHPVVIMDICWHRPEWIIDTCGEKGEYITGYIRIM